MQHAYSPMILRSLGRDGLCRVNWPFREQFGLASAELGAQPLDEWLHPDDRSRLERAVREVEAGAALAAPVLARHRTAKGDWVDLLWRLEMHEGVCTANGTPVAGTIESEPEMSSSKSEEPADLKVTLDAMARIVEAKNPGLLCSILLMDERREYIVGGAGPSLPAAYNKGVEGLRIGPDVGSCGTAAYWNTPVIVEDIANDPLWCNLRDAANVAGVAACWSFPVVGSDGAVLGAMALYDRKPGAPQRHQIDGLAIAAKMVGMAVERDRLEQRLRRTEKMQALGLLAGGVAHDFNNLLVAIIGNSELALTRVEQDSELAEMLQDVLSAGNNAAELCRQILTYSGRNQSARQLLDCSTVVREMSSLLRLARSENTKFELQLTDAHCSVFADRAQLQSLVTNLITNACDAIGERVGTVLVRTRIRNHTVMQLRELGVERDLSVAANQSGEFVAIEICDSGDGVDEATQSRMFDPFFSTKSSKRGLGLAAVQGIVASHGGAIVVESKLGEGTCVKVLMPRAEQPVPSTPVEKVVLIPAKPGKVLLADDEGRVRDLLARTLRDAGHEVLVASDGQQAVRLFAEHRATIHCVLLDYRMPKLDGGEALHKIREMSQVVPVIMISGYADCGLTERYRESEVFAVLQKPTTRLDLVETVGSAMRQDGLPA